MRFLVSGALALGLMGSAGYLSLDAADGANPVSDPAGSARVAESAGQRVFTLARAGADLGCAVTMAPVPPMQRAELRLTDACPETLPALAEVRYWQDDGDGAVMFLGEQGQPVVEFFAADGVAYESIRPARAMLSLSLNE
ncbi:AprI/Inh family metalloprotease inhibitor [Nitratireductor pacificus]|nr:AprI/Inh family metalloprotease inhibitor [Nitratireductor pacificus]